MVMIKIILLGRHNLFPCFKHIAAVITDVETGRVFLLNHPFGSYDHSDPRASHPDRAMQLYQGARVNFCVDTLVLFSRQNYDAFLDAFNRDFRDEFSWFSNNCATSVNRALDYFFPGESLSSSYSYLQLICLPYFLLALALNAAVDTPPSVYEKAVALALHHGQDSLTAVERAQLDRISAPPLSSSSSDGLARQIKLDEWTMLNILRPLSMI